MRKLCGAVFIISVMLAIALTVVPAPASSAERVEVFYQPVKDIDVYFPNGKQLETTDKLIIVVHSSRFDMTKMGIMFYQCDRYGVPDKTTSVTPDHTSVNIGNTVTHTFHGLNKNVWMYFSDPVLLDGTVIDDPDGLPFENPSVVPKQDATGQQLTTVVIALTAVAAAAMFVISLLAMRSIDIVVKEWEEAA